ncbi:hypothetical protein JCM6882_002711 [Rhodosporidiobolus microsporus]
MSASDDAVARFVDITATSPSQAQFYLDSAGGDLDAAIAQFFESGGNDDAAAAELPGGGPASAGAPQALGQPAPAAPAPAHQQSGAYTLSGAPAEALPAGWGSGGGGGSASGSGRSTPRNPLRSNAGPRITGFRDLASAAPSGGPSFGGRGGDDDSDEEGEGRDPAHFFTGGARSGLSVENPDDPRNGGGVGGGMRDMIRGILQQAREGSQRLAGGGGEGEEERPQFFGGSAHTLGSDETPSTYIPDPHARPGGDDNDDEDEPEEMETAIRHLTFWQDGFSIEDGDLLKYEEHSELLAAIQSGRAPLSLLKVAHDQPVELRIAERRSERWVRQPPPAAPSGPWVGSGNRLGSVSPFPDSAAAGASSSGAGVGSMPRSFGGSSAAGGSGASASAGGGGGASVGGQTVFEVDRNEPTTQVQIRLRNGERMVATFNLTHTVGDLRHYINSSSPAASSAGPYVLQTTFPTRDLTDDKQTIKDAGVAGSVVVQRPV